MGLAPQQALQAVPAGVPMLSEGEELPCHQHLILSVSGTNAAHTGLDILHPTLANPQLCPPKGSGAVGVTV